ncbi:hypothetical protein Q3G72_026916 [Acer saccharum]|nr:hypothetical protein Q3G72_026916 [Acer saccharum]
MFGTPRLSIGIRHDIWSVENQIPFFILEDLFELAKCYDGLSISKLVSPFCGNICELLLIDKSLIEINFSEAKHFVDLLRLCIEPSDHQLVIEIETMYIPTSPTIMELHRAGVKFEIGSNKHLFDIRFDKIKGTLEIPKLRILNVSRYFKNLQMFEELHCEKNHVNDYAIVLSLLVRSPKDAELLIQNGILEDTESVEASTFGGEIGKQARWWNNRFYYRGLARDLNDYCKSPWATLLPGPESAKRTFGLLLLAIDLLAIFLDKRISFECSSSSSSEIQVSKRQVLQQIDKELINGNDREALSLVKDLQGKPGGLRCFGATQQVPQRLYTLDELKMNGINTSSLLSPVDGTLQLAAVSGGVAAWNVFDFNPQQIFYLSLALLFLWTLDSVSSMEELAAWLLTQSDTPSVKKWLSQQEAGHFLNRLPGGELPKAYTLSSLEALKKEGSLNLQAGTAFVDFEFLEELNTGKVSSTQPNIRGYAEGGLADINKLDVILQGLGFTQKKADSQVRLSVLNTVLLLRRHEGARAKLAEAMTMGKSVGSCIEIIEDTIDEADI